MENFKLGNLVVFSEDQRRRLFEKLFEEDHHFTAVELKPDSVRSFTKILENYGKSNNINVIPLNIVKDGELDICIQTIIGI
jgi:hypothetical protein